MLPSQLYYIPVDDPLASRLGQTCTVDLREGLKLADSLFSGGWWVGPKDDCLLASLRLDPFCDTTSTLFTPNLTVEDR